MMQSKSVTGIIIVAALFIIGVVLSAQKNEPERIPLGVILPLTGDAASYGEHARNAVELAVEKAKRDFDIDFDVHYEDSQIKPALAANAAQKLVSIDEVGYLVGFGSGETLAMCPIAEKEKRILFSSGSSPAITNCGDYTFRNYPSDTFQGKALARFVEARGFKHITILYINNDYGNGLRNEFIKNFSGTILLDEGHAPQTRDFRTAAAKIKSVQPDALVLVSQIAEASVLLDQLHAQGISIPVFGSEALKDDALIKNARPESLQNLSVLFTAHYNGPEAAEFKKAYQTKFKVDPGAFADYVHDNVLVLAKALQECKKTEVGCVRTALSDVTYTGATGVISFDEHGDIKGQPYELYRIENGVFTLVK